MFGREVIVTTPLRMCPDCQALFGGGTRASELREVLGAVPEYDALLRTYPGASVAAVVRKSV